MVLHKSHIQRSENFLAMLKRAKAKHPESVKDERIKRLESTILDMKKRKLLSMFTPQQRRRLLNII